MITPKNIDEMVKPSAQKALSALYNIGKEQFNIVAPNINYDNFSDFAQGFICGIEYIKTLMMNDSINSGNFEWTKGDFIQKQGEV